MHHPTLLLSSLLLLPAAASAQLSYVTSPKGYDMLEGNVAFFNWGPTRRLQGIDNTLKGTVAVFKELALRRDGAGAGTGGAARTMDLWIVLGTKPWGILSTSMDANFAPGTATTVFTRKSVNFPDWSAPAPMPPAAFDWAMTFDVPFLYLGLDALVWSISYDLSTNTSLAATDRQWIQFTPTSAAVTSLSTGCVATGMSASYSLTASIENAGTAAGLGITSTVANAPAGAAVVLFLDAVQSNVNLPGLCATLVALPTLSVTLGTASPTGGLANAVVQFPYVQALENQTIYLQCASLDAGKLGIPASLSNGARGVVPVTTVASGMQAAYQWSSLPTVTSTIYYGGSVIVRLGY